MSNIVIVDKNGTLKELKIKKYCVDELYKKAGFKTSVDFSKHHTFNILLNNVNFSVSLYGKLKGRANQENKYEFPPPVDKLLFFGSCILINNDIKTGNQLPLQLKEWEHIYDKFFKGFDECEYDECESDDENIDLSLLTKDGYLKDKFIVDDNVIEYDDYGDNSSSDNESNEDSEDSNNDSEYNKEYCVKKTTVKKINKKKVLITKKSNVPLIEEENYLDCSSELITEEYL